MTGFCGFSVGRANAAPDPRIIQDMGARLCARAGDGEPSSVNAHFSAVATAGTARTIHGDETLLCAITGRPIWADADLATLAEDQGQGKALAQAYRTNSASFLRGLMGAFALAIVDFESGDTLLAVDRIGRCPLAYSLADGVLVFGSRIEAIHAHPAPSRDLDAQALYNYLYFHMIPSPGTAFSGVRKLLPGEFVRFRGMRIKSERYWAPEYVDSRASEATLAAELRERLEQAVSTSLDDSLTGAFLSGGLDSSTVAGYYARIRDQPVDAYAIGFDAKGYDEMEYARATARHFGINLHEYYVTPEDVVAAVPRIAASYDEPFGNASAVPTYYCARFARESGQETLLAGDGGDEIFAGNSRYVKQSVFDIYSRLPTLLRSLVVDPLALRTPGSDTLFPLRKIRSYVEQARMPMPDRMESYNFLHRTPLAEIFEQGFLDGIDSEAPLQNIRSAYHGDDNADIVKRMLRLDLKITLADNDLRKVNRMCELAGIEVRYPMLADDLVEFAARVPSRLLLRRLKLRAFYKRALSDFLAPETLAKSKHGFGLPFGVWMREHPGLHGLARDSLESFRARRIMRDNYVDRLVAEHEGSHAAYYGVMIWVVMMLEQWLQAHGR